MKDGIPTINMQINMGISFKTVLDTLVQQYESGFITIDQYYAVLDGFETTIEKYRNRRLK